MVYIGDVRPWLLFSSFLSRLPAPIHRPHLTSQNSLARRTRSYILCFPTFPKLHNTPLPGALSLPYIQSAKAYIHPGSRISCSLGHIVAQRRLEDGQRQEQEVERERQLLWCGRCRMFWWITLWHTSVTNQAKQSKASDTCSSNSQHHARILPFLPISWSSGSRSPRTFGLFYYVCVV